MTTKVLKSVVSCIVKQDECSLLFVHANSVISRTVRLIEARSSEIIDEQALSANMAAYYLDAY